MHPRLSTGWCLALLLVCSSSHATLGEKRATPNSATATVTAPQLRAQASSLQTAGATQQSSLLPNGTQVTEFMDRSGTVFAVTWEGPVLPDLPATLGRYFAQFSTEVKQMGSASRRSGALNLRSGDLVVHSEGRMGRFSGYAYVQSLLPAGLDLQDVLP